MKFLKLLDPWERGEGTDLLAEDQQRRAAERFPDLVNSSRLHYWNPGDSIPGEGIRYLVGLAATYDLRDLRLADIINEQLESPECEGVRVDVFNAASLDDLEQLEQYYSPVPPITPGWHFGPIVGKWVDGQQVHAVSGYEGRKYILEELGSSITVDESMANLCPPDRSLMEG